ncbi:hypothetical protein H8S22_11380 [Anaerostipes sp. NSJ-7]|uniref:Uncharacterized protein n=1 Tax=Anaerostipes hominis (ex Liu et al. 2021) TaxID=2763018 RepID=A0ABR7FSJ0_9FIRM|nr:MULTISPECIES: hypothetical protein [Anaerostipes]MBC5678180.1 hypothetical protein [Anaerostipes hominis (ex Liu et al. 2021)]
MNNVVEKALELDQFGNDIPDIEQGGELTLSDLWDGTGDVPQESWSIQLTDSDWINYCFEVIEEKEDPLDNVIRITDIELL